MVTRAIRLVSLSLILITLSATDVTLLWSEGTGFNPNQALAQSRKRSKKKKPAVSRKSSKRKTSAQRNRSRRAPAARRSRSTTSRQRRVVTAQAKAGQQIPADRVLEIQRALIERGYLKQASGEYDSATVGAMKAFQAAESIGATGYPTAHALHRLGLPPGPATTASTDSESKVSSGTDQP